MADDTRPFFVGRLLDFVTESLSHDVRLFSEAISANVSIPRDVLEPLGWMGNGIVDDFRAAERVIPPSRQLVAEFVA
jgi:hypothetical protein